MGFHFTCKLLSFPHLLIMSIFVLRGMALPASSNRELEASAGTSVGCLLSASNTAITPREACDRRSLAIRDLRWGRLFSLSESSDFLSRLLWQQVQSTAAANTTARPTPTPIPALAPVDRPAVLGPGKILLDGRVIANKLTLFTASSVKTAWDRAKLFLS